MESKVTRVLQVLASLSSGRMWSVDELAAHHGVSERTIRRDIRMLRELGYGVRSQPGPGAGYSLSAPPRTPSSELTVDEVSIVATGLLLLESRMPHDPSIASARSKFEQLLSPALRRRAAAIAMSTDIPPGEESASLWAHVGGIADAVAQGQRLAFTYTDSLGRCTERLVEPYRHVYRDSRWYLVGYDKTREAWRCFRIDRMAGLEQRPGPAYAQEFPFSTIEEWLTSDFGRAPS